MPPKSLICHNLIPVESVRIGRLVIDTEDPLQDYLDPPTEIEAKINEEFHSLLDNQAENVSGENFVRFLTSLSSKALSQRNDCNVKVKTNSAKTYRMVNLESWFKNACNNDETQKWIEDMVLGESVHVVSGYHTLLKVRVLESDEEEKDSNLTQQSTETEDVDNASVDPIESICAIQYGRVKLRWFSSSQIDPSIIEKGAIWDSHQGVRGEKKGIHDLVDAEIDEDMEFDEILEKSTFLSGEDFVIQNS